LNEKGLFKLSGLPVAAGPFAGVRFYHDTFELTFGQTTDFSSSCQAKKI
jgi:hypothetical protein